MADDGLPDVAMMNTAFRDWVPFNRAIGLELLEIYPEQAAAVLRLPWSERLVGNPETGVLHGGALTTFLDAAGGVAVYLKLGAPLPIATLDLRIDHLGPATPRRDLLCRVECVKATRNVGFVRGIAYHDDVGNAVATSAATYMISTKGPPVTQFDGGKKGAAP